jgi:DNA-binding IscR family transcriptional regulator
LLAASVNTNAVVVRRLLSELRQAGLVVTHKGAGGGANLSRAPETITLGEIYRAVVHGPSFSHHPHPPNPRCPVGRKIEEVLSDIFAGAQSALEASLERRTLAEVLEDVIDGKPGAAAPLTGSAR